MVGNCDSTKVVFEQELYDDNNRYGLKMITLLSKSKIKKETLPMESDCQKEPMEKCTLLNQVVYTGYPNSIGPLSIDGTITGAELIYILYAYAWEVLLDRAFLITAASDIVAVDVGHNLMSGAQ